MARLVEKKYLLPFILITTLFFMWGFARSILDVLNKHFQDILSISISRSALIQATTYMGYFLMAVPAGMMISRYGYRKGVTTGLLLFASGCLLFIPGEALMSFGLFLGALFVIGCGLVILETAANPYAAELGEKATAASRLNLSQSFNGLGCILGPVVVGGFLFSNKNAGVALPYGIMGICVILAAVLFSRVNLPEIKGEASNGDSGVKGVRGSIVKLLSTPRFRMGLIALFCYEVAEISINSLFINYFTTSRDVSKETATYLLSFGGLGLFMLARIVGSWVMSKVKAATTLLWCAVAAFLCAVTVAAASGLIAQGALLGCYIFEAIMFPTIFALTISYAGESVKIGSSLLMMTPLGGAVGTLLMGLLADSTSISASFIVPAVGYLAVTGYSLYILRSSARPRLQTKPQDKR